MLKLILAFTLIPFVEIYLLIEIGQVVGALPTVLLVVLTGVAGAALARSQGIATMLTIRDNLQRGIMPAEEMLDGVLILVAGVVLVTPGFMTDIVGLLLLVPTVRAWLKKHLKKNILVWSNRQR